MSVKLSKKKEKILSGEPLGLEPGPGSLTDSSSIHYNYGFW